MKSIKILFLFALTLIALNSTAQTDKTTTAKIIAEKKFVFVATTAFPLNATDINNVLNKLPGNTSGGTINLSGNQYDVKIAADSVIAYLPYYGRSFSAPIDRDDSGIKFTSTDFTYSMEKVKKGWRVNIFAKDSKESPRLNLSISENGYASLNVSTTNKQSISYNGYIAERK